MFRLISLARPLLKCSSFNSAIHGRRGFILKMTKKKIIKQPSIKAVEKLNLVPKDYEVIYIFNYVRVLTIANAVFLPSSLLLGIFSYKYFTDPDFLTQNAKEASVHPFLEISLFIYMLIINFACKRTIRYIFKKGDQLKVVCYGCFFGRLGKQVTDCTAQDFAISSANDMFVRLKGKGVFLEKSSFLDPNIYLNLFKTPFKHFHVN